MVHVRHEPAGYQLPEGQDGAAAQEILASAVNRATAKAPLVRVNGEVLADTSVPHAILKVAGEARMVVVGSQGRGILRETIGSTAHAVLHHARGPVLISRHGG